MLQIICRLIVAAVVYAIVVILILPGLFGLIGMPVAEALLLIIKGVGILLVFAYGIWGPPLPGIP